MLINRFSVSNYKCFNKPAVVHFSPGINIITGQNNSGKTALLEALSSRHGNPHVSAATVPKPGAPVDSRCNYEISFTIQQEELTDALISNRKGLLHLPVPVRDSPLAKAIGYANPGDESSKALLTWFLSQPSTTFSASFKDAPWRSLNTPSFADYEVELNPPPSQCFARYNIEDKTTLSIVPSGYATGDLDPANLIAPFFASRIYAFRAERFNIGISAFGIDEALAPNATNLAQVLNTLQKNTAKFKRFTDCVRRVLPQIRWISVKPEQSNRVEILVWSHDPASERVDLAISLNDSGTGVGQVLAMIYVALTSNYPQVIIIDEPQSFLHPGAVRKLIEVLKDFPQHQFIIATHSPTLISAADPKSIAVVRQAEGQSTIEMLSAKEAENLRIYLAEVGATLADVFGADGIIWVEGPTEEISCPKIVQRLVRLPLKGKIIKGVVATGDFERRHADLVLDIYDRLSGAGSLLPPALAFLFDDDARSDADKKTLIKKSGGRLQFLPRRMFENYLLNAKGIAEIANRQAGFRDQPLTEGEVETWISSKRAEPSYYTPLAPQEPWIKYVRGDKLLKDLFTHFSETRVEFRKPEHSVALTEWLIENDPEALQDVSAILMKILKD